MYTNVQVRPYGRTALFNVHVTEGVEKTKHSLNTFYFLLRLNLFLARE